MTMHTRLTRERLEPAYHVRSESRSWSNQQTAACARGSVAGGWEKGVDTSDNRLYSAKICLPLTNSSLSVERFCSTVFTRRSRYTTVIMGTLLSMLICVGMCQAQQVQVMFTTARAPARTPLDRRPHTQRRSRAVTSPGPWPGASAHNDGHPSARARRG